MKNRLAWMGLVAAGWSGMAAAQAAAQPAQPEQSPAPAMSADELLDLALVHIRQAEARGPDAQEAFRRAREAVEHVLGRDKFHRRASYYRARLLVLADRSQEALGIIQRWVASPEGENDWEAHLLLGRLYQAGGFHKLARPSLNTALSLNPREPSILTELAECEADLLEYEQAARHTREAIGLLGADVTAGEYVLLARILMLDRRMDEAERQVVIALNAARSAVREGGATRPALGSLGDALDLARRIKESGLQTNPQSVDLYLELAQLIRERGQVDALVRANEALAWAKQGLATAEVAPPSLYLETIDLLTQLGRTQEAHSLAAEMMEVHPNHPRARELVGDTPEADAEAPQSQPSPPG